VGLATAVLDAAAPGRATVDGFIHRLWRKDWPRLLAAAESWAAARGCTALRAVVAAEDEAKRTEFAALGFGRAEALEAAFEVTIRENAVIHHIHVFYIWGFSI
jgi:hypothetical protein